MPRLPTGSGSKQSFGTVTRLSQLTTLGSGRPSSGPTTTSERMPRIVRVMGAHVTAASTSTAASLVSTQTGRRLAGGPRSAQMTTPRATTREPCGQRGSEPPRRGQGLGGPCGRRPSTHDRRQPSRQPRVQLSPLAEGDLIGSFPGQQRARRVCSRGRHLAGPAPLSLPSPPYGTPYAFHQAAGSSGVVPSRCSATRDASSLLSSHPVFTPPSRPRTDQRHVGSWRGAHRRRQREERIHERRLSFAIS